MNDLVFSGKASFYAKSRPSYPQEFIDYLYTDIGVKSNSVIADIGSGTGKLTRLLLERGSKVFAVEPNDDMRAKAESELSRFDNFLSVSSAAESTALDDKSVDFVTIATAFHWFDRKAFKTECRRILKDGGKAVIVYNSRDEDSDVVEDFYKLNRKHCPNFKGSGTGVLLRPENAGHYDDFFEREYMVKIIRNDLIYDEQSFIGRCLSSSYALKEGDENYFEYIEDLKSLFHKHSSNNMLTIPNITHSYTGTV